MASGKDQERIRAVIAALRELLEHAGWRVQEGAGGAFLKGTFGGGPPVWFAIADEAKPRGHKASELLVWIHDDAFQRPSKTENWIDLNAIASRAHAGEEVHTRFGWDLVFGFGASGATPLVQYLAELRAAHKVSTQASNTSSTAVVADLLMKVSKATRVAEVTSEQIRSAILRRGPLPEGPSGAPPRNALIAYNGCVDGKAIDQAAFLVSHLIESHIEDLTAAVSLASVPVLLTGEQMRLDGLGGALRQSFWSATRRSYSNALYAALARLGYLHIYIANGEALRVDQDFDPNTRHITDVFNFCEGYGRFTLCCARDYVFHDSESDPVPNETPEQGRWEIGSLRTLGQRFFLAETFYIVDFGDRESRDFKAIVVHSRALADEFAEKVSDRSGGRCSQPEARAALGRLGKLRVDRESGVFARGDLRTVSAGILTEERRRPVHIAVVEAALAESGAFSELNGGRLMFSDGLLAEYLLANEIATALRYALIVPDYGPIEQIFKNRISESRVHQLACHLAGIESQGEIAVALGRMTSNFDLFNGPGADKQIQAENMFRLLFAAADHLVEARMWERRSDALAAINGGNTPILIGMALPQFSFRDVNLEKWRFENCNFRSAAFIEANLTRFTANDCYLGGAVFKQCRLNTYTDFSKSNLSGSWFGGGTNPEGLFGSRRTRERLQNVNWTLAFVDGQSTSNDEDDVGGDLTTTREKFELLRASGGILTDLTVIGRDGESASGGLPVDFRATLLRGIWEKVVVEEDAAQVIQIQEAHAPLSRGGAASIKATYAVRVNLHGKPGLAAIADNGDIWATGPAVGSPAEWKKVGQLKTRGEVGQIGCFDQDTGANAVLAAVEVTVEGGGRVVEVIEPEMADGAIKSLNHVRFSCLEGDGSLTTLKWIRHSTGARPELYYGTTSGIVRRVLLDKPEDKPEEIAASIRGVEVGGLCFAKRSRVLVITYNNGLVIGVQTPVNRLAPPLFSFKTAIRSVFGVVYLEGEGDQMVLVGSAEPAASDRFLAENKPLCVLMNASGDVLAVFERPVDERLVTDTKADEPKKSPKRTKKASTTQPEASDAAILYDEERLKSLLAQYRPESARLEVRPLSEGDAKLVVRLNTGIDGVLTPVVETSDGPAFRQCTLKVSCWNEHGEKIVPVQEIFTDHECDMEQSGQQLEIVPPIQFGRDASRANLSINIAYRSIDRLLAKTDPDPSVDIDVIWRDNPYESSGRAAAGRQYFGREKEAEFCIARLSKGYGVGIRAARRMGKSSFLSAMARDLTKRGHLAIVVSLSGSARPSADLASLIIRGAEDPLAPVQTNFLEMLKSDFRSRVPRGRAAIERLSELAERIFTSPTIVFIDEWGVVANPQSNQADQVFEQAIGELIQNRGKHEVAICLASTPADFGYKETVHTSSFYRGLQENWLDMGPLDDVELERIMSAPIKERKGFIKDKASSLDQLKTLSSGDPYAVNVIMSRAYDAAVARAAKEGVNAMLHIGPADIGSDQVRRDVAGIYDVHMGYTFDVLTPENRALFMEEAARKVPRWEAEPVVIPDEHADPRQWNVFAAAGFRRSGADIGNGKFAVWIPRGYSLNVAARGAPGARGG